ncbi:hypothetical protein [Haloferax sp. DFSO52]|uniref:DUF7522 family protein n=1 Tax=Haloferax sp. DFSO52 TaxID=3388505 RepID=UPI003A8C22A3
MSDASSRIVEAVREFGEDSLRDLWVFDRHGYEHLYIREDVADAIDSVDVAKFIDNERFGYITRDTYEALYYADYGYTVRGFDTFEQFRTFVGERPVGMFAGFDRGSAGRDFSVLNDQLQAMAEDIDFSTLTATADLSD